MVLSQNTTGSVIWFAIFAAAACLADEGDDADAQLSSAYKRCLSAYPATSTPAPSPSGRSPVPNSGHLRPPASAAEAQKILDHAEVSGHVGKLLQQEAEKGQLGGDVKNEWELAPELKDKWQTNVSKIVAIGANNLNDEQLKQLQQRFAIPQDEQFLGFGSDYNSLVNDVNALALANARYAVTDKALYLVVVEPPSNRPDPDTAPHGRFRLSHRALLATDDLAYGRRVKFTDESVRHEQLPLALGSERWCIASYGSWLINGNIVMDFGSIRRTYTLDSDRKPINLRIENHDVQEFLREVVALDIKFALEAARERHLEKGAEQRQPKNESADVLAAYLGVPWGSSFDDTSRRIAAKGAANYTELHVSEAEWNRMTAGEIGDFNARPPLKQTITDKLGDIPVRPPFAMFDFSDDTGTKQFLFYQNKFYAVAISLDSEWVHLHGEDLLKTMCQKYGQPTLGIIRNVTDGIPLTATWETNSGSLMIHLKPLELQYHLNISNMDESIAIEVDRQQRLSWGIKVEAAGFVPGNWKTTDPLTVKAVIPILDSNNRRIKLTNTYLERRPAEQAKGKFLVVVVNITCANQINPLNLHAKPIFKTWLSSHAAVIGPPNLKVSPISWYISEKDIFPNDHQHVEGVNDFEEVLYFDVPSDAQNLSLVIDAPIRIHDRVNAEANNQPEILDRPAIIDLEQTDQRSLGYAGQLDEKEMKTFRFCITGSMAYVSKDIAKKITDANNADKAKEDQRQKELERKRQKEFEGKF